MRKEKDAPSKPENVESTVQGVQNRDNQLPTPVFLSLILFFAYPFFGPLLVGQFSSAHLGVAFLTQVFLGDGYFLDLGTYFFAGILLFCGVLLEAHLLKKKSTHHGHRVWGKTKFIISYVILLVYLIFNAIYFGPITLVLTPALYVYGLLPIYCIRQLKKEFKN